MRIYYATDEKRKYSFMSIHDRNKWIVEKEGRRILTPAEIQMHHKKKRQNKS